MNVDGTGLTKLTSDKKDITFMQYLPKSDKILFVQDSGTYIMNSDGGQRLFLSAKSLNKSTKVTQDEQTAYFYKDDYLGFNNINATLYAMSLSTGEVKQLLQDSISIAQIGISPDGVQLLYNTVANDTSLLVLLNTTTFQRRIIKIWVNELYCSFPQFVPNSDQIIFFDRIDSNSSNSYLRIMDLADTANNQILDTVNSYYERTYPALNTKGEIFYAKNGITVLDIATNQKIVLPSMFRSDFDFSSWSYDGTKLIVTNNESYPSQMVIYTPSERKVVNIKPSVGPINSAYTYPYLNSNNTKTFFTISFTETVLI